MNETKIVAARVLEFLLEPGSVEAHHLIKKALRQVLSDGTATTRSVCAELRAVEIRLRREGMI